MYVLHTTKNFYVNDNFRASPNQLFFNGLVDLPLEFRHRSFLRAACLRRGSAENAATHPLALPRGDLLKRCVT